MARSLPPLNAIRVFEAAARLGGFTRAAGELAMTQAAVSYQIRQLEDRLGVPLFVREPRGVTLTEAGQGLARRAGEALDLIAAAAEEVRYTNQEILTVTVLPTFCSNWLLPRLGAFQLAHPRLAVRIDTSRAMLDLRAGEADIAIRLGHGDWPGLASHFLFEDASAPLVPAGTVARFGPFERPRDLLKLRLFGPIDWWRRWFAEAGETDIALPARPALELETQMMEIAAALGAHDAASIVSPFYFQRQLAEGSLVQPFDVQVRDGRNHYLVYDAARAKSAKIRAFADWILLDPHAFCLAGGLKPSQAGDAALTPLP